MTSLSGSAMCPANGEVTDERVIADSQLNVVSSIS